MSKRVLTMLAGVAVLAMLVGGCGSSSDGSDDSLTKAEFIKQADAVCKQSKNTYEAAYKKFSKENGVKEGEYPPKSLGYEFIEDFYFSSNQARIDALRELTPPSDAEEKVEAFLVATEKANEKSKKNVQELFEGVYPFAEARELSEDFGFKACGQV